MKDTIALSQALSADLSQRCSVAGILLLQHLLFLWALIL